MHLSASDFAKNRDVTPQHVNNWFKRGVPMARLDEIAELLCVTSRWLRTGEGPKPPPTNYHLEGPNPANNAAAREDCGHYLCGPGSSPEKVDVEIPLHASFNSQESLRLSLRTLEQLNVTAERALGAYMVGNSMIDIIPGRRHPGHRPRPHPGH